MPPLDLSDMQDDSGMDQNSEASPIHSQDTYGGIQLEPMFSFAFTDVYIPWQSSLRHVEQHCIRHVAAHYASSKSGADSSLSDKVKEVPQLPHRSLSRQYQRTCISEPLRRSMDDARRPSSLSRLSSQGAGFRCLSIV